jgi:cell division protein FtsI (penicillin-binding protein 3)
LGLVGESDGNIRPYKTWRDIELSNIAFGQGLSVNGLQMARMYGMVANGGDLYPLSLIKKIVNSNGDIVYENKPRPEKNVLSPEVAAELRSMLYQVTQPGGTARTADIEGYRAGGKTGTAQKFNVDLRAYEEKAFTSSFVGFTPLDKPRYAVSVVFDRPSKNGYFGGIVAAPAFKDIAEKTLAHFGVAPPAAGQNALVVGDSKNRRDSLLPQSTATHEADLKENAGNKIFDEAFKKEKLPDFRGLSLRRALAVTQNREITVAISGQGVVVDQTPQAGTALKKGDTVTLKLAAR